MPRRLVRHYNGRVISKMKNIVSPRHKFYLGRLVEGSNIFLELLESTDNFGGQQGVNLSSLHVISASYKTSLSLTALLQLPASAL